MRFKHLLVSAGVIAILLSGSLVALAQSGPLRGIVKLTGKDGQTTPVANAAVDVYRTDIKGEYHTKTEKNGDFVFAGLPLQGTYVVAISAPDAQPNAKGGVRVINLERPIEFVLAPGDGRRLTADEAKAVAGGASTPGGGTGSTGGTAKLSPEEEARRKAENERIAKENEKNININKVVGDAFKAGNAALNAKNYDEALKQYDMGLAADPEQPALLTNKTLAFKARGVERYNAAIQTKDEAARTSGLELAKADFKAAADAANRAAEILKKVPTATDPEEQKQQNVNKYAALSARAEAMRLYVTKADANQADAARLAFQDYIAIETDAAKKSKAQLDMAQMMLDAGSGDKAFAEFQKILGDRPDDPDANLGAGLALFSTGDKAKYQEAANYLQHFVDKAPDNHKFKADAVAILKELKSTENVVPEKTTAPSRRKRP
jgi:tetratricopeptide (TPR) repeat protein